MSCSCSALNADSNDTKVDQDWQKGMVRINDIYSLATHKYQLEVLLTIGWMASGLRIGLMNNRTGRVRFPGMTLLRRVLVWASHYA